MLNQVSRPPTLTETTVAHLQEAIIRGELLPGTSLQEVELGKSLQVSRSTVREALRQLQAKGLIEIVPHRGAFVAQLSPRKAREIATLRAQLEPYAVRLALENQAYQAQDLVALEQLVAQLGKLEKSESLYEIIKTDMEFHRLICERSDHELLLNTLNSLRSQTRLLLLNMKHYRSDQVPDEASHRAILQAIQLGDPIQAEAIVRKHITQAGLWLLEHMEKADWQNVNVKHDI